eukprot:Gregarina_sp_Pseudo_9__435@NODE_1281_length_1716_cov_183_779964_g1204_i0_p1_GENE_NODE_1281_length_1716_cov_183_779964_g1204_i0NODE_1281_length_1716_cov_183_779964_g1204_i0_p1_ORF_typecomplete_len460_score133_96_NODE_1281_length_1716_cov_183_779964_g1204_i02181597
MKTFAKVSVGLFAVAQGGNTLTGSYTNITHVGVPRAECEIEQCLGGEHPFTECLAAAAEGCAFTHDFVVSGALTDTDVCAFPGPVGATETPLWLKLDLNAAGIGGLADYYATCTYVSGNLVFETVKPRSGTNLMMVAYGSASLACDDSIDDSIAKFSGLAQWTKDATRVEFRNTIFPARWNAAFFDGNHAIVLNAVSGFTQDTTGGVTGFTAEDWTINCVPPTGGTFAPVSPFAGGSVALSGVSGTCVTDCADTASLAGVDACITAAAPGCGLTATYTVTDANLPARSRCVAEDGTQVIPQYLLSDLGQNTDIRGSLFLDIGSKPAETCQIEVALLTSVDLLQPACGLADAEEAGRQTFTVGPENRSMKIAALPDNFAGIAITADKDWRLCGGAVNAFRTASLTSTLSYVKEAPVETTEPPVETEPPVSEDPFDRAGSSGVLATLTLAAASFGSLVFFL